jgi:tetratricopeptide (TPR) repeat protein
MLYKYADFLRKMPGDETRARELLERAYLRLGALSDRERRDLTFGGELCALVGLARESNGDHEHALEATEFGVARCRSSANLHYVRGVALLNLARAKDAEAAFRACRACHGQPALVPAQPKITGTGARLGLARALALQRRDREAAETAWEAAEGDPENHEAVELWADLEVRAGDLSKATARLISRVRSHPSCGMTWFKGGELFFRLRLFDKALPWILRAAELLPDLAPARALQGETLLCLGHHEAAAGAFMSGLPDHRCRAGLMILTLAYEIETDEASGSGDVQVHAEFRRIAGNLRQIGETQLTSRLEAARRRLEVSDPAAALLVPAIT